MASPPESPALNGEVPVCFLSARRCSEDDDTEVSRVVEGFPVSVKVFWFHVLRFSVLLIHFNAD